MSLLHMGSGIMNSTGNVGLLHARKSDGQMPQVALVMGIIEVLVMNHKSWGFDPQRAEME